jgi:hypothetical protein
LLASKACDLTGVIGIACAQHGCFVPNALVDLFKGEQQKNVDFAFLKTLNILGIDADQGILLIYNIACQYSIYLAERIGNLLPTGLAINHAIDLFHVHAHKDDCFFRFATTFIPGAAVVASQIIESLWSNLNSISPTVRTATLPHRAEMLDDHAWDSNHKKLLCMAETLRSRFMDANTMVDQTDAYYLDITSSINREICQIWEEEIKVAEAMRCRNIKAMDIYAARLPDRLLDERSTPSVWHSASASGPASATSTKTPIERWIEFGLLVEETQ